MSATVVLTNADFKKMSDKVADDKNYCVGCMQTRTDVPVTDALCYQCGGGKEVLQ